MTLGRGMIVCLVTDRARRDPIEQARFAIEAGIDLIHVRERDLDAAPLASIVRAIVAAARGSAGRTRVVVNDRLDVALACGADGVHLRGDSMDAARVREAVPAGFLIGRSIRTVEQARAAGPVDFLVAGTLFPSASKGKDAPVLGSAGLAAIVRASAARVLAIGGIDAERVAEVAGTGAAGIAAIGLFAAPGPLTAVVAGLRERFDTVKTAS